MAKVSKAKSSTSVSTMTKKVEDTELNEVTAPEVVAEVKETPAEVETTEAKATAKAGKRSAKALKEAGEKEAKASRKAAQSAEADGEGGKSAKQLVTPTRTRLERQGKKFRDAASKLEKGKAYAPAEALELATQTSPVKFDATVELHVNLGIDPKHADQNIRDNLVLPAGTGKSVRVAVFADDKVDGADLSGVEAITKALEKGELAFDILIATPANMAKLGKYARLLGPRGLMPNPKSGTVTNDVAKAVAEAKAGRVEYRVDSTGIVHLGIGKVSFGKDKLLENFQAVMASIKSNKPTSVKGNYIQAIHVTTSMGPGITVSPSEL